MKVHTSKTTFQRLENGVGACSSCVHQPFLNLLLMTTNRLWIFKTYTIGWMCLGTGAEIRKRRVSNYQQIDPRNVIPKS
jgi:hypothetical protein